MSLPILLGRYHRILDLQKFRNMVADGVIPTEEFVTVKSGAHEVVFDHLRNERDVVNYFRYYKGIQARHGVLDVVWSARVSVRSDVSHRVIGCEGALCLAWGALHTQTPSVLLVHFVVDPLRVVVGAHILRPLWMCYMRYPVCCTLD